MKTLLRSLASSARAAYERDKRRYRDLIVRVIEDAVVLYMLFAAIWSLAYVTGGILNKLEDMTAEAAESEIAAIAPEINRDGPRKQLRREESRPETGKTSVSAEALTASLAQGSQDAGAEIWRADVPMRAELQAVLLESCEENGVDPLLMLGLIEAESGFEEDAVSPGGDHGLCQLNQLYFPSDLTPEENVRTGVALLGLHLRSYGGDIAAALTAYNRGHDDGTRAYAGAVLEKAIRWGYLA